MHKHNVFFHIDLTKNFCHPCDIAGTNFPCTFLSNIFDDAKYEVQDEMIYDNIGVNGTSDDKILKIVKKHINDDFVIAEGYACKFWLQSKYKNHLLLINPFFSPSDNISTLFSHPENTYIIISYEYRHTINDLYTNYLTDKCSHTFLYYGEKCSDINRFYGLSSIIRYFITEILSGTEYWKVADIIESNASWHFEPHEYGYDPESEFMLYSFIPDETLYKTILCTQGQITYIDKSENKVIGRTRDIYEKTDEVVTDFRHEFTDKLITWKYSNLNFCNQYTEKIFKKAAKSKTHDDLSLSVMIWYLEDLKGDTKVYIDHIITFSQSSADINHAVDKKMKKFAYMFEK